MNTFLSHIIESAVYLAGFYLIYFLFLSRDTRYGRNRGFIIISVILSFILPVITFDVKENSAIAYFGKTLTEIVVTAERNSLPDAGGISSSSIFSGLLFKIYIAGAMLFGLKFLIDVATLLIFIARKGDRNNRIVKFRRLNTPGFSAFGYVFIKQGLPEKDAEEIIRHERTHLARFHFFDILLIETVKALQWFNPFIYLINKSLRAVHEYQADEECINSGTEVEDYRNLLMNTILNTRIFVTSNSFSNPSLIRKRMLMMTRERTSGISNLKVVLAIPVAVIIAMLISACEKQLQENIANVITPSAVSDINPVEIFASSPIRPKPETRITPEAQAPGTPATTNPVSPSSGVTKPDVQVLEVNGEEKVPDAVFVVVEEMPLFPGGEKALLDFIYSNIQYPEKAKQENIQGRVILRFCINYKGGVEQVTVIKGVDPSLDNEAVRVIKMLPQWQPGKQGGKPVNVWYSVPVTFQLR